MFINFTVPDGVVYVNLQNVIVFEEFDGEVEVHLKCDRSYSISHDDWERIQPLLDVIGAESWRGN